MQQRIEGSRDDVATGAEQPLEIHVRLHRAGVSGGGVEDTIDIGGECDLRVIGGGYAERSGAGQFARVLPHLRRIRDHHPNELEVPMACDRADRRPSDISRSPDNHSQSHERGP